MSSVSHLNHGILGGCGHVLPLPHSAGMQSSLPLLQKNYKFTKVFFWGKLIGTVNGDYLIAMGIEESYTNKKFFYCQDGVSWAQLPTVTEEMIFDCAKIATPALMLTGDASKLTELPPEPVPEDAEEGFEPEKKTVDELTRLAVIVSTIDTECAMLPAGALVKQPSGKVEDSQTYKGMDFSKATSLKSYVFVNKPKDVSLNADAIVASTEFLTPCDTMVPKGALVMKFEESLSSVCWRSLVYEGFIGYSIVGGPMHGYCYFGSGLKNSDIAFMLP